MLHITFPKALILIALSPTVAAAQDVNALCFNDSVRSNCPASCVTACQTPEFLEKNVQFCVASGALTGAAPAEPVVDGPACVELFSATPPVEPSTGKPDAEMKTETAAEDCSTYTKLSERRRCELKKVTPACAPTVTELEARAMVLVDDISAELSQYGDMLERDWTDVSNRDLLCAFSIDELDQSYEAANDNPDILRTLQRQATDIQGCQVEWEDFVRSTAGERASDQLIDNVSRDAEKQLAPLKAQIEGLGESVRKLESAAGTIEEIVDVHIVYCPPGGTPLPAGSEATSVDN